VEGSCGAAEPAGLTILVLTRQWRPLGLFVFECGLPGVMAAAAGMGDPSLQVL
jgi:hypothetical protein